MFVRGGSAESRALQARGFGTFDPVQKGSDRPLPPFLADTCEDGCALAIRFTGRNARRTEGISVVVSGTGFRFPTHRVGVISLEPGSHPIRVKQSRIGVNAGAVTLGPGEGLILEYRVNVWGPPGGAFITHSQFAVPCSGIEAYALHFGSGYA